MEKKNIYSYLIRIKEKNLFHLRKSKERENKIPKWLKNEKIKEKKQKQLTKKQPRITITNPQKLKI